MSLARSLKVHLRVLDLPGATLRVVTLRPQTTIRFSTNRYHDTWHILASTDGATLLGQLLWGLAFQRLPGTLLLIDAPHLAPTPFDGDPPDRIAVLPEELTRFDPEILRALALRLRRAPGPPTTIRWHTFGLPAALERDRPRGWWRSPEREQSYARERMSRTAGFICFTAPQAALRERAVDIHHMGGHDPQYSSYYPLAETEAPRWHYDGEVQVLPDFTDNISAAVTARREILGDRAGTASDRPLLTHDERSPIYARQEAALQRLRAAKQRRPRT